MNPSSMESTLAEDPYALDGAQISFDGTVLSATSDWAFLVVGLSSKHKFFAHLWVTPHDDWHPRTGQRVHVSGRFYLEQQTPKRIYFASVDTDQYSLEVLSDPASPDYHYSTIDAAKIVQMLSANPYALDGTPLEFSGRVIDYYEHLYMLVDIGHSGPNRVLFWIAAPFKRGMIGRSVHGTGLFYGFPLKDRHREFDLYEQYGNSKDRVVKIFEGS